MKGQFIVKVQRAIVSGEEEPPALIYDEGRTFQGLMDLEGALGLFDRDELKIFCYARWRGEDDLEILARAPWQEW